MTVFLAILLTTLAFAFIIYPFFRPRAFAAGFTEDEQSQELYSKRDTTYSMLKELEFDLKSGILTEEDYRDLESRYQRKAINILKEIDDVGKGTAVEDPLENQIMELRRRRAGKSHETEDDIEKQVRELRRGKGGKGRFCTQCGAQHEEGDRFCSQCGTKIG